RDGTLLASGAQDQTIRVWHANAPAVTRKLVEPGYPVGFVAFGPRGDPLYSRDDAAIHTWHPRTGRPLGHAPNARDGGLRWTVDFDGDRYRRVLTSKGPTFQGAPAGLRAEEIEGPLRLRGQAVEYAPLGAVVGWLAEELQSATSYPGDLTIAGAIGT